MQACISEIKVVESRSISLVIATPLEADGGGGESRLYLAKGLGSSRARQLSSIEHSLGDRLRSLRTENKIDNKNHQAISSIESGRNEIEGSSSASSLGRNLYLYPVTGSQPGEVYYRPMRPQSLYAQSNSQPKQQNLAQVQAYTPIYTYGMPILNHIHPLATDTIGADNAAPSSSVSYSNPFVNDYGYLTQPSLRKNNFEQTANSIGLEEDTYGWRAKPLNSRERPNTRPNLKKIPEVRPYEEDEIDDQALVLDENFQPTTPGQLKTSVIDIDLDKDIIAHGKSATDVEKLKKEVEEKLNKGIVTSVRRKSLSNPSAQEIGKLIMAAIEGERVRVPDRNVEPGQKFGHPGEVDWSKEATLFDPKFFQSSEVELRKEPKEHKKAETLQSAGPITNVVFGVDKKESNVGGVKPVTLLDLRNELDSEGGKGAKKTPEDGQRKGEKDATERGQSSEGESDSGEEDDEEEDAEE